MNSIFDDWNSFVLGWIHNSTFGPNYLYNTAPDPKTGKKDYSRDYIPEPWWGNCGDNKTPLYSVCLNLNPGKGDYPLQTRSNKNLVAINRYEDVFKLLPATDNWHETKRAQPIAEALKELNAIPNSSGMPAGRALDHHLSVELIPWHTEHATAALGFWQYVENEIADIFNYSFMLAAEESERITAAHLKKTVLMRFSESTANLIFRKFRKRGLIRSMPSSQPLPGLSKPNVHATIFTFPNEPRLSEHRFVAIWRSKGYRLNDFPDKVSMTEIIGQL